MLWMERVALSIYLIVLVFSLLCMALFVNLDTVNKFDISDFTYCFGYAFAISCPCWIIFRTIDFIGAGPLRRKLKAQRH